MTGATWPFTGHPVTAKDMRDFPHLWADTPVPVPDRGSVLVDDTPAATMACLPRTIKMREPSRFRDEPFPQFGTPNATWLAALHLSVTVPMKMLDLQWYPVHQLYQLSRPLVDELSGPGAEAMLFPIPGETTRAINTVTKALACLALISPTGVEFLGLHWCVPQPCPFCPDWIGCWGHPPRPLPSRTLMTDHQPDMSGLCLTIATSIQDWHGNDELPRAIADAVLAAGWYQPRVITKPGDLVNVPSTSVLRTRAGVLAFVQHDVPPDPYCLSPHEPHCEWFKPSDFPTLIIWEPGHPTPAGADA